MKKFEKFAFAEDFKKNMEEKSVNIILAEIDTLLENLKTTLEKLKISNAKYVENPDEVSFILFDFLGIPSTDLQRSNRDYSNFFKIRNLILKKFNTVIENKNIDQKKIDIIVDRWKNFEDNFQYGSYNMENGKSIQFSIDFISYTNNFLEKMNRLKNEFEIDLDTEDKFILTPTPRDFYVPCRKSLHEKRIKDMRSRHMDIDPFGEENW